MTRRAGPSVIALAGPNGAGKSTVGPDLLRGALRVTAFVNADVIAQGLSAFDPGAVAMAAGRAMRTRLRELAGRAHATWLRTLIRTGYAFRPVFLWLPSPELAVERVRSRAELGGHSVPGTTIRRRYISGLRNFFTVYRPMVHDVAPLRQRRDERTSLDRRRPPRRAALGAGPSNLGSPR